MSRYQHLALTVTLYGCGQIAGTASQAHRYGSVREPSGAPSSGTLVTVTDLATADEVSILSADSSGRFALQLPPGHYAFAAASASGFAFEEKVITSSDNVEITLSSNCHRVRGRVTGTITRPARVRMSRFSRSTGDRFVADVGMKGEVMECLPSGSYWAQVDGAITSLSVPVAVPAGAVVELTAYAKSQVERPPGDLHIEGADLGSFTHSLFDHQVIGLGEANHGTGDFYTYRARLSLELARVGKLRTILLEADAIGMLAIDDYVMGGDVDIAKAVVALKFWITDIYEFLTFLADVRMYNAAAQLAEKVHVLGIDAQRLEPPVQLLLEHRVALGISEGEADLLARIEPQHGKAFTSLSSDERAVLLSLLDRLGSPPGIAGLAGDAGRASIAARSVRYQLGYLGTMGPAVQRDQAMAGLAAYIVELGGARQAAVWAHNAHLAREPAFAEKSLGQHLSERFGEAYYPIAFLSYRGTARAWDAGGTIGVIPHELAPTPPYNVESAIMVATRFAAIAWVRLDTASGALKQWLSTPRYVREFGAAYVPKDTQMLRAFPEAFAAVVVIQRATASTPTPTGVRTVAQ